MIKIVVAITLAISFKLYANQCCSYTVNPSPILFSWDSTNQLEIAAIDITLNPNSNWLCSFTVNCKKVYVDFNKGQSSSYNRILSSNTTQLDYNLTRRANNSIPLKLKDDASSKWSYFKIKVKKNSTKTIKVYGKLPIPNRNSSFYQQGIYTDLVQIRVYPRNNPYDDYTTVSLPIKLLIPPTLELSIIDSGAPFDPNDTHQTLNFGTLHSGDMQQVDIKVKSNAGLSLSLSSENGGRLKHNSLNDHIAYTLHVDNQLQDLSSSNTAPIEVARQSGITPLNGHTVHLKFTVGDVTNKSSGEYQDNILVTAMAID